MPTTVIDHPRVAVSNTRERSPSLPTTAAEFFRGFNELTLTDFVNVLRQAGVKSGANRVRFLEDQLSQLKDHQVQNDILKLEQSGVRREIIALAVVGIRTGSLFDQLNDGFGSKRVRHRTRKLLLAPLSFLTKLSNEWGEAAGALTSDMFPSPLGTAKGLEQYAEMQRWREWIKEFAGVASLLDVAKYAFSGAVKRITGTYHDREVSALIGATLQESEYHMEAHRFWRKRMYSRLDRNLPFAALLLQAANSILSQK